MNVRVLKPGEPIPEGAKRIHLYRFENMLRPRGGVAQKESLSLIIAEQLQTYFESWTDPEYGDSRPRGEVLAGLEQVLKEEVSVAWAVFARRIRSTQGG